MLKFTLVLALCAALIYQTSAASQLGSGKDDVKKAFHQMMDAVDKALTQAQTALNKAMEQVKAQATELETKANGELDKVLDPLRHKLDDLVAQAKAKGFDVSKCSNYVEDFSQTPDHLVHNLVECVNTQVAKAQHYVDDALKNAKDIEANLNKIDAEIDDCGGNAVKKAKCYAKLIEKIAKVSKDAPQHIVEDFTKATALVTGIVAILEDCFTHQLKKAGEDASKDIADLAVCLSIPIFRY